MSTYRGLYDESAAIGAGEGEGAMEDAAVVVVPEVLWEVLSVEAIAVKLLGGNRGNVTGGLVELQWTEVL